MRRIWFGGVLFVVAVVLTGCFTQQPPAGYLYPVIESAQVSPQPVQAGETLTVVIEASDDSGVSSGRARQLVTPDGIKFGDWNLCTSEPFERATRVLITITCPVPVYATNGTWEVDIVISDSSGPMNDYPFQFSPETSRLVPFEVVGGTEDHGPPQLVHYETEPATVTQATTFTLTMRLRDEALPVDIRSWGAPYFVKRFASYSVFVCRDRVVTPVSSTELEMVWTCSPQYDGQSRPTEVGVHRAVMTLTDALGHKGDVEMFVDAKPT